MQQVNDGQAARTGTSATRRRLRGALALGALAGLAAAAAPASAALPINQRLLRPADLKGSQRLSAVPKPLKLAAFVKATEPTRARRSRAMAALRSAGFRQGAHVTLAGPGLRATTSTAIQLASAARVDRALEHQLGWVASLAGSRTRVSRLASFPMGRLVRITSRTARTPQRGWGVVFARGAGVYMVVSVAQGDVPRAQVIALARKVLSRAR